MEDKNLVPKKQSLFPISAEDIVDNALQNLDENQARDVTKKAADEIVRIAVEKRKAEYKNSAAQEEMRNLINNANLLDKTVGDYKINSTFETASGTTNVEIRKAKLTSANLVAIGIGALILILLVVYFIMRS
jgi:D-mannonate dehydratase